MTSRRRKNKSWPAACLYTQLFCLMIGGTLNVCPFVYAQSTSAALSPLHPPITLGTLQTGQDAPERPDARFDGSAPFSGRLVYAWDTAPIFFSGLGNDPPWQSYLTVHPLESGRQGTVVASSATGSVTYPVLIPKYEAVFQPQYSPDGTKVLIRVGNYLTTNYVTYRPLILDIKAGKLTEVEAPNYSIGNLTVLWSSDSRYIAYLRHGFALPFGGQDTAQLYVYDTRTGKNQQVVENEGVKDSFAWTSGDKLLYSIFPSGTPPTRPPADLYEFSVATGKSILLRHDAYRPASSPDGKEVVFLAVSDPRPSAKSRTPDRTPFSFTYKYAANKYLVVWSRVSGKAHLIRQEQAPHFSELRWFPDSRGLVLTNRRVVSETQDQADITTYDLETDKLRKVATVPYADYEQIDSRRPLFVPLTVAKNSDWLFFTVQQPYMATPTDHGQFLRAIRLADGTVSTLCFVPGYNGLDWQGK